MKLSEFLNLSMCDMAAYVEEHINRRYDHVQKKESILYEVYDQEYSNWGKNYTHHISYNDIWTDERNFDIEQDNCGWEVIPMIADVLSDSRDDYNKNASLLLRKKSNYGLVLYAVISKDKYSHSFNICINPTIDGSFINNDNYPIVLIDKADFSKSYCGLPISFNINRDPHSRDEDAAVRMKQFMQKSADKYPFNGIGEYVYFPETLSMRSIKTSKFNLLEYGERAEAFAKCVQEHIDWFDRDYKKNYTGGLNIDYIYRGISKKMNQYIFYISLKYMFNDITWEDYCNLQKIYDNNTEVVTAFLKKCKTKRQNNITLHNWYSSSASMMIMEYNQSPIEFSDFTPILARLDEFRKLVGGADTYALTLKQANESYNALYNTQSNACGQELDNIYKFIDNKLSSMHALYNKNTETAYKDIVKTYKDVKKDIVKKIIDLDDIRAEILQMISKKMEAIGYQGEHKPSRIVKTDEYDKACKAVKKIAKQIYDILPNSDSTIVLSEIRKCEDAPYELHEYDIYDANSSGIYAELVDTIGELAADELMDQLCAYAGHFELDGSRLYPGCSILCEINKNLEIDEQEIYD